MDELREKHIVNTMRDLANYVLNAISYIKSEEVESMIEVLISALDEGRRVLIVGVGRSGLIGKAFAVRLMHLGYKVFVMGDTIVPALRPKDILIAISGSGRTKLVIDAAEVAKSIGAKVIALTSFRDSPLANLADIVVEVPGRLKVSTQEDYFSRQILGIYEPLSPLASLYEVTVMAFLDGLIIELTQRIKKS
ncbi:MAG: SIS domain-containing protein [Sulfolobales archaeon]|nr:SIS domain-containing protein [Sulfolobales archaeon]